MAKSSTESLTDWQTLQAALHARTRERGTAAAIANELGIDRRKMEKYVSGKSEPAFTTGMKIRAWLLR